MSMENRLLMIGIFCFAALLRAQEQGEVEWSWQTPEDFFEPAAADEGLEMSLEEAESEDSDILEPGAEPSADAVPAAESTGDESWMWEEEAVEESFAAEPALPAPAGVPRKRGAAINVSEYDAVLKENLDLRREADAARQAQEAVAIDNQRLRREMQDLEARLGQLALTLQKTKQTAPAAEAEVVDKALELEKRLAELGEENEKLLRQVAALQQALTDKPAPATPAAGSDLYREIEQENTSLKEKLNQAQAELRDALAGLEDAGSKGDKHAAELRRAWETGDELRRQLAQAADDEKKHRQVLEKLLRQIPQLEEQLADMASKVERKDAALAARDKEFEAMKLELDRREYRLIQAEKMTDILDDARRDVGEVSKRQQRDMHYNMALVYAKEGKFREAEREYLRALRLDPTDSESHYNLGILYDDQFNDKRRAAMHYRRYLKLNPNGQDADAVKGWLMQIEMQGK